mgnify:CR=1 FL=1
MIDFSNAFFQVPLHPDERRHFCITLRGKWYLFKVMAQGAAASPLIWGRAAALVSRLTQSMFHPSELLLQTFVDDPIGVLTGSERQRNYFIAMVVLSWSALGFPLAFKKGQRGREIVWIGATLQLTSTGLEASIKKSILDELRAQVADILKSNVVSRKVLRSFAGRCNHVATLLWPWRPFLQSLWAALSSSPSGAPRNCVWTRQIRVSLYWIKAFLEGSSGSLHRTFSVDTYMGAGMFIEVTLDASPWGLGGILQENGQIVSWFASDLSDFDFKFFGFQVGEAAGQQCWEALAALVALRVWKTRWRDQHARLTVRGGSVAMLAVLMKFKAPTSSRSLGIIAREVAIDVAEAM